MPDPFERRHYLNIETFRKNGQGVKTPLWFVLVELKWEPRPKRIAAFQSVAFRRVADNV